MEISVAIEYSRHLYEAVEMLQINRYRASVISSYFVLSSGFLQNEVVLPN